MILTRHSIFILFLFATFSATTGISQTPELEIRDLLSEQATAWNKGDIPAFMEGYHKSADLHFLGKSGLTEGWSETLERYERGYPDQSHMGQLSFDIKRVTGRTDDIYTVIGKFTLKRTEMEDASGFFLLVVQKFDDQWKVVADSTH